MKCENLEQYLVSLESVPREFLKSSYCEKHKRNMPCVPSQDHPGNFVCIDCEISEVKSKIVRRLHD